MIGHGFNNIKKLSTKLLICTVIPMLIILVFAATTNISAVTDTMYELSLQQLRTEASFTSDHLTSYLANYMVTLSSERSSYTLKRYMKTLIWGNNPETNPYYYQLTTTLDDLRSMNSNDISMVWIADFDSCTGLGDTESGWKRTAGQWQLSQCPWYDQSLVSDNAFISNPYISLHNDIPVVSVIVPIRDDVNDRILGILSLDLRLEAINKMLASISANSNTTALVLDEDGKLVSHPNQEQLLHNVESANVPVRWLSNSIDNTYGLFSFEKNDTNYLGYASPVQGTSWTIVSTIERSAILKELTPLIVQIIVIFILSILLYTLIIFKVSKMITQPLQEITAVTKEIANGNYALQLSSPSQDEVGQLAKAANTTIQALRTRALFDSLTGLYNEFAFISKAEHLIMAYPDKKFAIVRFDIARFKMVNDMFGTAKGDSLLKFIASVLRDHVPEEDAYGRISADIFVVCIPYSEEKDILDLVHRITYHVEAYPINFNLTPYFGICEASADVPISTLLDWTSLALKTIKGSMLSNYAFYNSNMREALLTESYIEREMSAALENKQFVVYLQPKCDISTSEVVGSEALVRWMHPEDGLIRPDIFIPLFEKNGFIIKLDEYVWEETCKIIRDWIQKGYPVTPVSVNISRVHIFDPGFCDKITSLVLKYDIPFHLLELEFTESAFVGDSDELYRIMETLKRRGFVLLMDDFGSGYSSLNMLKNSPVDIIKIDREFLNESSMTESGRIIVRNTLSMLRQLNLNIVAEGVETPEQARFLLDSGCSIAQGYYYSKPIEVTAFERFAKLI